MQHANSKRTVTAIIISGKTDVKKRNTPRNKEGHFMISRNRNTTVLNAYTSNNRALKQKTKTDLIEGKRDNLIIIPGHFNIPPTITDRTPRGNDIEI